MAQIIEWLLKCPIVYTQTGSISSLMLAIVLQGGVYGLAGALLGGVICLLMQWSVKEGVSNGFGLGFLLGAGCAVHMFSKLPAS